MSPRTGTDILWKRRGTSAGRSSPADCQIARTGSTNSAKIDQRSFLSTKAIDSALWKTKPSVEVPKNKPDYCIASDGGDRYAIGRLVNTRWRVTHASSMIEIGCSWEAKERQLRNPLSPCTRVSLILSGTYSEPPCTVVYCRRVEPPLEARIMVNSDEH